MNKKDIENNKDLINELAERRTIEMLAMSNVEIAVARAYESTKAIEVTNIKDKLLTKSQHREDSKLKELSMWDVLFRI